MKRSIMTIPSLAVAICMILSGCSASDRSNLSSAATNVVNKAKSAISSTQKSSTAPAESVSGVGNQGTATSGDSISVFFPRAGQDAEGTLIGEMNTASKKLDVAIYSFTDTKIADAIAAAQKRGVTVRLMTDRECASENSQKTALNIIKAAGIPIKDNTHSGIMHLKVSIIDTSTVTTGSFNYTKSAQNTNDENLVIIRDSVLNAQYEAEFSRMWSNTKDYADWNG